MRSMRSLPPNTYREYFWTVRDMATTPEGRIKNKIKLLLDSYGHALYVFMPVQTGYGSRTLDYLGCVKGVFFGVEAKRPKGKTTALQDAAIERIDKAGGQTFVVSDDQSLAELKRWLDAAMKIVEWRVYP